MDTSLLRLYSFGRIAENKMMSSNIVEVFCIEAMSFVDGEVKSNPAVSETKGTDAQGKAYTGSVTSDNTIPCRWLPLGSNRVTPPDWRRGERVIVLQYGDNDEYYVIDTGWDAYLRKLETVLYTWSAHTDEADTVQTKDNCYALEISTHTKQITLSTTNKNGEPFRYTLQFNTGEGVFTIIDDAGNFIELDSSMTKITLENKDGTRLVLDKENIFAQCNDSMTFEAKNDINFKSTTFNVDASDTINLKASNSTNIATPTTNISGAVNMGGGGGGSCTVMGPITSSDSIACQSMAVEGTISCGKLISRDPISAPNVG